MHAEERATELLADRATQGLTEEEKTELQNLLGDSQDWETSDFDLAAAALNLSSLRAVEPLPVHLRAKVEQDAFRWLAEYQPPAAPEVVRPPAQRAKLPSAQLTRVTPFPGPRVSWGQRAGWYLAAAACLALALTFAWPYLNGTSDGPAADLRARLLNAGGDVVALNWTPTGIPEGEGVTGDVVWSQTRQQGFMRFRNLKPNDAQSYTYQLWIFDGTRDERYPVDGGYFDIPAGQTEVVVPIKAKLPVNKAALFALTIEPPGGVVVSKREKIVVVAKNL
jgi:anti-sigma-K factor RskA